MVLDQLARLRAGPRPVRQSRRPPPQHPQGPPARASRPSPKRWSPTAWSPAATSARLSGARRRGAGRVSLPHGRAPLRPAALVPPARQGLLHQEPRADAHQPVATSRPRGASRPAARWPVVSGLEGIQGIDRPRPDLLGRPHLANSRPGRTPSSWTRRSSPPSPTRPTPWSSTRRPRSTPATGGTTTGWRAARARAASPTSSSPGRPSPASTRSPPRPTGRPRTSTLAHAAKCERDSPKWYGGKTVTPHPRPALLVRDAPAASTKPRACSTSSSRSIRPTTTSASSTPAARSSPSSSSRRSTAPASIRPLKDVWVVEPALDIAKLRREALAPTDADALDHGHRSTCSPSARSRRSPRTAPCTTALAHETNPVPPGYGFRRLDKAQLTQLPNLRQSVLAIWEYPRLRGPRRYVMAVDVSDGLGPGLLVIDIIRQPTIEEPAEQVAQYLHQQARPQGAGLHRRRHRPLLHRRRRCRSDGRDRDQQPRPGDPGHPAAAPGLQPLLRLGVCRRRRRPSAATAPASAG